MKTTLKTKNVMAVNGCIVSTALHFVGQETLHAKWWKNFSV
jgi:hypothetical protein